MHTNGRMGVLHKPFPYTTCETKQNEKVLFVRLNQIGNLRKGNTSFVN